MANIKIWLRILGIVLVFGMSVIGCDNGTTGFSGDTAFNGIWVSGDYEVTRNNGNFETYNTNGNIPYIKGTYTTSNGLYNQIVTHVGSGFINTLEPKWYSKNELEGLEIYFGNIFLSTSIEYSITGNTITFFHTGGTVSTQTRK